MDEIVSEPSCIRGQKDYDYIGTGGFLIDCGDDSEVLGITKEQAELVKHNCPFFQKCLHHGSDNDDDDDDSDGDGDGDGSMMMKEARSQIIRKPDWSLAIVRHFIEILTKGKTTLPNLKLVDGILAAGDQSLVDLRLSSLVNYLDPCCKENDFVRLVNPTFFRFQFQAVVTSDQWLTLLDRRILLYREETNFVVQLYKDQAFDRDQSISRRNLDSQRSEFMVHAERSIEAIFEIQRCLSLSSHYHDRNKRDGNNWVPESFSIYFETSESIPKEHHQLIDRLAGGEAYIRTCADAAEYQTEGYTVKASLDVLARAIEPISEENVIHCSIRVDNPTPDTLGRFINACQNASDYPGTLGLDASINRYFCRKSIKDVLIVLKYMRDYSTPSAVLKEFHLFSLSSEAQSF
uniref:Uncharacterized protein n=1 Tax=Pseudo-nitzschia australis TaxID=44445 RepID=A0A7S4AI03_9STRA|mmetsp:Transcript_1082/g.2186  ORF Transcript_1082/g.2186 Transcript_1082/m.2186 type:complete len:405 (+) Transcript_1082:41-1255(+)